MAITKPIPIQLTVRGMTCNHCAMNIEKYLRNSGNEGIRVDIGTEEVSFDLVQPNDLKDVVAGIEKLGFSVAEGQKPRAKISLVEQYFLASFPFSLLLLSHMFLPFSWLHDPWIQLGLCIPVFLIGLWYFGRSAYFSLKSGSPNMDVLIIMGATAAFFYSLYGTLTAAGSDFLFYETAASIISLVLLGNVLEHRSIQKTTSAIQDLSKLKVEHAKVWTGQGNEYKEISTSRILKGDILVIHTGDRIPVDGKILWGSGELDESMINGESLPLFKEKEGEVMGGTLLVSGNIRIQVNRVGNETTLSRIIDLVKKAQADKPSIQKLADRISEIFVPLVLGISLLTFLISYFVVGISMQAAIIHSVAVLVISCPCAMGLATPTAVVVGIGRASRKGILIKGARTLEAFGKVGKLVFDKTGTLTTGDFQIKKLHAEGVEPEFVRQILFSLAQHSTHPISKSIHRELASEQSIALSQIQERKGIGMEGRDEAGNLYQMGSKRLLKQKDIPTANIYLLKNGQLIAWLELKDQLRPGAKAMIDYIKGQGLEPIMLSGDSTSACNQVAQELGITRIYSEKLPDEKLQLIEQMSEEAPIAMLGDGINDAPALAKAQVGISLGGATDIAIQSSQIILLKNDLSLIPELFKVSRHTVLTIKQNLFWAFFYNIFAIPMAAVGLLSPIVGAAAMAMSDVVVIGNSLRLRIKRI